MSLQPKTRKYRVCFRNKTYKKAHLLTNRNCGTGFTNFWHSEDNLTFKDSLNYKPCNHSYPEQYKVNFTDSTSFITTKNKSKSIQQGHNQDSKRFEICNNRSFNCFSFVKTESILISDYKDSSSSSPVVASLQQENNLSLSTFTNATIDKIRFGQCGFYFSNTGTITAKFIDTVRLAISRKLKKSGRFWIRVCPDTPVTARSAETRMGRGKGAISHYEAKVEAGQMFIEFGGVPEDNINQIYSGLLKKSPIKLKLMT